MGTTYLLNNPNNYTQQELEQRIANNQIYAQQNPNTSYTNTATQTAQTLTNALNNFSQLSQMPASAWQQYLNLQQQGLNQQASNNTWNNWLGIGSLALSGLGQWMNYSNAKKQLAFNKQALAQQQANWDETYNNKLKQYNTELADRLRARAAFETGDSTAYDDEITANSARRGETGNSSSSYLNYSRSSNANNPYNKDTDKDTNA